jgi:hypothetical protein
MTVAGIATGASAGAAFADAGALNPAFGNKAAND